MEHLEYERLVGQAILEPQKAERTMGRYALRYAVSRQMVCPTKSCGAILDCRTAVMVEIPGAAIKVVCPECWEGAKESILSAYPAAIVTGERKPRAAPKHPRQTGEFPAWLLGEGKHKRLCYSGDGWLSDGSCLWRGKGKGLPFPRAPMDAFSGHSEPVVAWGIDHDKNFDVPLIRAVSEGGSFVFDARRIAHVVKGDCDGLTFRLHPAGAMNPRLTIWRSDDPIGVVVAYRIP